MRPEIRSWGMIAAVALVFPACELPEDVDTEAELNGLVTDQSRGPVLPQLFVSRNAAGALATFNVRGRIDTSPNNPFFKSFGINERTCGSCHVPANAWTISPPEVQQRFTRTQGLDPIFRLVDGANAPNLPVATVQERRRAYSMLLTKGLIRVGIGIPANAEFELAAVDDPYRFASAKELSLFRRPMPSTNLKFLSAVMWDGRESTPLQNGTQTDAMLHADLSVQSNSATRGHAEATADLGPNDRRAIVDFQQGMFTAQLFDNAAGLLTDNATGGPQELSNQETYFGINDVLGADPTGAKFDPNVFRNFDNWAKDATRRGAARQAIARGQVIFNTKKFQISGVRGVNNVLEVESLEGTCTTCHDHPNVGNHSTRLPLDLGLGDASRRTRDMPLYTLRHKTTGETIQTTDPGRALITGRWSDVNLFKGPILHGLAARPPFFHNGFAANLDEVVTFYNDRFKIELTAQEKADLAKFLATL